MIDHHFQRLVLQRLDRIEYNLEQLTKGAVTMSKQLDDLTAQVAANTSVEQSAITLIQGLHDQLVAAGTDPAKLEALQTQLKASADALAAAVSANTPAAPAPAPAPAPTPAP